MDCAVHCFLKYYLQHLPDGKQVTYLHLKVSDHALASDCGQQGNFLRLYARASAVTYYREFVTALRFIGCHNQSELFLCARDQSCLSDDS